MYNVHKFIYTLMFKCNSIPSIYRYLSLSISLYLSHSLLPSINLDITLSLYHPVISLNPSLNSLSPSFLLTLTISPSLYPTISPSLYPTISSTSLSVIVIASTVYISPTHSALLSSTSSKQ